MTDRQKAEERLRKDLSYFISGEDKYAKLPNGGCVVTDATEAEIEFFAALVSRELELEKLRTTHENLH